MRLRLTNGYPYPYPLDATAEENDAFSEAAGGTQLRLEGVKHFEWLHTVTVEFNTPADFKTAEAATNWGAVERGHPRSTNICRRRI